jgi:hypothetical protein
MRSVTRAVRVVALTVALGTVATTSGAGAASAWWSNISFGSQEEKATMVSGVGIPDDLPRFGDLNPGLQGITPSMLPVGLRPSAHINGLDKAIDYSSNAVVPDPRQNLVGGLPGSAAAAKTAVTAKPGPSRTTKPGPSRTTNSRGR